MMVFFTLILFSSIYKVLLEGESALAVLLSALFIFLRHFLSSLPRFFPSFLRPLPLPVQDLP